MGSLRSEITGKDGSPAEGSESGPLYCAGQPGLPGQPHPEPLAQVLVFLQALVAAKKQKLEQEATALLKEAVELHFSSMQGLALSPEYFEKLDPLFLVCIAKEYLHFCPKQVKGAHLVGTGLKYRCGWCPQEGQRHQGRLSSGQAVGSLLFFWSLSVCCLVF